MATTSRFVDVPMVVAIPPSSTASPTGMRTDDGESLLRTATPMSIGSSMMTIGVVLTKELSTPAMIRVSRLARTRLRLQALASAPASGCRAPVVSMPLPSIIRAQIVISAWWPKPERKACGVSCPLGCGNS